MKISHAFYGIMLISLSTFAYATEYCPAIDAIQYDVNASKYVNTAGDITWSSSVMAVSNPTPTITFMVVSSYGAVNNSTIVCAYSDGNNNFSMTSSPTFSIDPNEWAQISSQAYYCKQSIAACGFSLVDSKTKKKT